MAGKLDKTTIKVEVDPYAEMDNSEKKWCQSNKVLKAKLKDIVFSEKLEYDSKKFTLDEIEEALLGSVRFDLKVFDMAVVEAIKKGDKAEDHVLSNYKNLERAVAKKMSKALEEFSGGDDNTKSLADGKEALTKLADVDLEIAFTDIAHAAALAVLAIHQADKTLSSSDEDKKSKDMTKAYLECAKTLDELGKRLKTNRDEIETAMTYMLKVGKKIKADKKASVPMNAFGKMVLDAGPAFKKYDEEAGGLQALINGAIREAKAEKITPGQAKPMAAGLDDTASGKKAAQAVNKTLQHLVRQFKLIEKGLT